MGNVIGALGRLRYKPAQTAVAQAFFHWLGVDSTFVEKPELLDLKRRLEGEIEREVRRSSATSCSSKCMS